MTAKKAYPFTIERVRLDKQGYDRRGMYYGTGAPVYRLDHIETGAMRTVRASTLAAAITAGVRLWGKSNPSNPLQADMRALSKRLQALTTRLGPARKRKRPRKSAAKRRR